MKGSLIGVANRMTNGFEWKGESANRVKNAKNLFFLDFSSILIVFYPENVIEKTFTFLLAK